jgi:hypothetical protein
MVGVYASERLPSGISERPLGESQGENRNRARHIVAKIGDPFPKRSNKHADIAIPVFNRTALRKSQHYCYRDGTIVSLYS